MKTARNQLAIWLLLSLLGLPYAADANALSRGHALLLERGLQLQTWAYPAVYGSFSEENFAASNLTTPVFIDGAGRGDQFLGSAPGKPWGLAGWQGQLTTGELAYEQTMVSYQYGDEQDVRLTSVLTAARDMIAYWHEHHPGVLVYLNQFGNQCSDAALRNYMAVAQPDMLMFDDYIFHGNVDGYYQMPGGSPAILYANLEKYRTLGLAGNDGTGTQPIPCGLHTQTFWSDAHTSGHIVTESELRLNTFAAWVYGFKMTSAFIYDDPDVLGSEFYSILFNGPGDTNPTVLFDAFAQMNEESRNLGPALVRLLSSDVSFVSGRYQESESDPVQAIPLPSRAHAWTPQANDYLKTIQATNLGTENLGLEGDVVVGRFTVLDESLDGAAQDQQYFMILNGLSSAYESGTATNTRQSIHLTFDFGASGIQALHRISRSTGMVETVTLTPEGGSVYSLDLELPGGTGDLFKYATGAPFVGDPTYGGPITSNGDSVYFEGETIVLSAEPGHTGYQWYHNGLILTDSGRASGTTTATLTIESATGTDSGNYECRFDNPERAGVIMRTSPHGIAVWAAAETPVAKAWMRALLAIALAFTIAIASRRLSARQ